MRYDDIHMDTLRARMRADIISTLEHNALYRWPDGADGYVNLPTGQDFDAMIDALVEDGMHPLEQIVAEIRHEDAILGRDR